MFKTCTLSTGLAILLSSFASTHVLAQASFSDDFNRPDSPIVGNGWSDSPDWPINGELRIANGALSATSVGTAIYRPFAFTNAVTAQVTFTQTNGYNPDLLNRFTDAVSFFSNGNSLSGLSVYYYRGDNNYADSAVRLLLNGNIVAVAAAPFQFDGTIFTSATVATDGLVTGSVTSDGQTFNFNFGVQNLNNVSGSNFALYLEQGGTNVLATADNLVITSVPEPKTFGLLLGGLAVIARVVRRSRTSDAAT